MNCGSDRCLCASRCRRLRACPQGRMIPRGLVATMRGMGALRMRPSSIAVLSKTGSSAPVRSFLAGSRPCRARKQRVCQPLRCTGVQEVISDAGHGRDAEFSTVTDSQMTWPGRTHGAGTLRESHAGQPVTVCGWVDRNRDMGGLVFLDIRDHTGVLQVCVRVRALQQGRAGARPAGPHGLRCGRAPNNAPPASPPPLAPPSKQAAPPRPPPPLAGRGRAPNASGGQQSSVQAAWGVGRVHQGRAAGAQGPQPQAAHRPGKRAPRRCRHGCRSSTDARDQSQGGPVSRWKVWG